MASWFRRRALGATPVVPADNATAYREGRLDERERVTGGVAASPAATRSELDAAYRRGRLEARRTRRGSPLLSLIVILVVAFGVLMIYLAVRNGSFAGAGAVVDNNVQTAAQKARAPLDNAANTAGTALENAGSDLKGHSGSNQP